MTYLEMLNSMNPHLLNKYSRSLKKQLHDSRVFRSMMIPHENTHPHHTVQELNPRLLPYLIPHIAQHVQSSIRAGK